MEVSGGGGAGRMMQDAATVARIRQIKKHQVGRAEICQWNLVPQAGHLSKQSVTELKPKTETGTGIRFQRHLEREAARGRVLFHITKKKF